MHRNHNLLSNSQRYNNNNNFLHYQILTKNVPINSDTFDLINQPIISFNEQTTTTKSADSTHSNNHTNNRNHHHQKHSNSVHNKRTISNNKLLQHHHNHHQAHQNLISNENGGYNLPRDYISATVGKDVQLDCKMKNLASDDEKIVWLKMPKGEVLTLNGQRVTPDMRINTKCVANQVPCWSLIIMDTKESDSGFYVCQTNGMQTKYVFLDIMGIILELFLEIIKIY